MIKNLIGVSIFMLLLLPFSVLAEESQFIRIKGSFAIEFNSFNSGNSTIFSPNDSEDSDTTKNIIGPDDRKTSYKRSNMYISLESDYIVPMELWLNFKTDSDTLMRTPNSVGLESTLLFPVDFLMDGLKVGHYHISEHNLDKGRYGNGIRIDGLHASLDILKDEKLPLNLWYTFVYETKRKTKKASPYIFTKDAEKMSRSDLGEFDWIMGFKTYTRTANHKFDLSVTLNIGDGGPASIKNRFVWSHEIDKVITLKLFTEYNRNLQKTDKFGLDEWLIGPGFEVKF